MGFSWLLIAPGPCEPLMVTPPSPLSLRVLLDGHNRGRRLQSQESGTMLMHSAILDTRYR